MILLEREKKIVQALLESMSYVTIEQLINLLNVSKRTIYNDLESLSTVLKAHGAQPLVRVRGMGYRLTDKQRQILLHSQQTLTSYQLVDASQRIHLLYCVILGLDVKIDIQYCQNITGVSRNTLFSDLKLIRKRLERYDLKLEYTPKYGYSVAGSLIQRRSLFLYHLIPLFQAHPNPQDLQRFLVQSESEYQSILFKLRTIETTIGTEYIDRCLDNLAMVMCCNKLNEKADNLTIEAKEDVVNSQEYALVKQYFPQLDSFNSLYYTIHLLGSLTQIRSYNPKMVQFLELSIKMIERFQQLAAIEFEQLSLLINNLANHLAISLYRYQFGLHQSNPMTQQIKTQYKEVFEITDEVCDLIRSSLKVPVSHGEVAYITLHFNSFLHQHNFQPMSQGLVIVCPQGISTSAMLKHEINQINPHIQVVETMSLNQFLSKIHRLSARYIVSTVDLPIKQVYIKVNPVLTAGDKQMLQTALATEGNLADQVNIDKIMEIVKPYISQHDFDSVRQDLQVLFTGKQKWRTDYQPSLKAVLTPNEITLVNHKVTLSEAIQCACEPLLQKGYINQGYSLAIEKALDTFGHYMALENGYALLHAAASESVYRLCLSFTKFNEPFMLGKKKVNKVFTLATINQQHLKIMSELLSIFSHESLFLSLDECQSVEEMYSLLTQIA